MLVGQLGYDSSWPVVHRSEFIRSSFCLAEVCLFDGNLTVEPMSSPETVQL